MTPHEHFVQESLKRIEARQEHLERVLLLEGKLMTKALEDLAAQVQANTAAEASAVQLIKGLADQLAAAATDPVQVSALAAQLKTSAEALAAAVVANTHAAPPAPPATPAPLPGHRRMVKGGFLVGARLFLSEHPPDPLWFGGV